jgi:hypothetical protein
MRKILATLGATLAIVGLTGVGSSHRESPRIMLDPSSDYEAYEPGSVSPYVQ